MLDDPATLKRIKDIKHIISQDPGNSFTSIDVEWLIQELEELWDSYEVARDIIQDQVKTINDLRIARKRPMEEGFTAGDTLDMD